MAELADDLKAAQEAFELYSGHVTARTDLTAAVAKRDRIMLRKAMDLAENLDMNIDIMVKAKEILRDLEIAHREQKAASNEAFEEPEPYDAAEEARKQRQELAKQARFDVKNFPNLRTSDDFARGAILNKGKVCF